MFRRFLVGIVALALVDSAAAQELPVQQNAKQLAAIAAQKLESDVRSTLAEVNRLSRAELPLAIEQLKETVAKLEADQSLSPSRKATLLRVVRDRLRVVENDPNPPVEKPSPHDLERQAAARAAAKKQAEDDQAIKTAMADIAKLQQAGRRAEAQKAIAELAKKHPDHLAVQLLASVADLEKPILESHKQNRETEPRLLAALRDVDSSGSPTLDDVEFPRDWKQRTAHRRDVTAPNDEERRLLAALDTLVDARWKNSRLQDVLDYLSTVSNRTIIADMASLNEANLTYDTPINFYARDPISLRSALRGVLSQVNLTFVVRDGIIHVTSPQKARDLMTTKVYYLGDLITGLGPYGGAPTIGMNLDQVQLVQNVTAIVNMITSAIDPPSWESKNGQGHIGVNLPTLSLTIRQSQEVHVMLRSALYGSRK